MMSPEAMESLHARAFSIPRPWSATEFAALLREPSTILVEEAAGFALGRVMANEAELLTLCVENTMRRQGIGARLLRAFLVQAISRGAARAVLEVASDNSAATALYARAGYIVAGCRRGYYRTPNGVSVDALVMAMPLMSGMTGSAATRI